MITDFEKYNKMFPRDYDPNGKLARFKLQRFQSTQFFADMKKDLQIEDNPKADKMLSIAWDLGHSGGYQEVYFYAKDLVHLIR